MAITTSAMRGGISVTVLAFGLAGCTALDTRNSTPQDSAALACERAITLFDRAQYDNFAFNFTSAETALDEALSLYDDPTLDLVGNCSETRLPGRPFILASRALALSNQQQFLLAERLFDQADTGLGETATEDERLLLRNFRVMHARNIEQDPNATAEERAAVAGLIGQSRQLLDEVAASGDTLVRSDLGAGSDVLAQSRSDVRQIISSAALDYVESGIAANRGDLEQAELLIDRAIRTVEGQRSIGKGYLPRFLVQKATIQLERAEATADPSRRAAGFAAARRTATLAVERIDTLFANTPIAARSLMIRAKTEDKDGDTEAALRSYRSAFSIYQENPSAVAYESVWPFFRLSLALRAATNGSARRATLDQGMFEAAQIVRSSTVANAIATSTGVLRSGANNTALAELVEENRVAEEEFRLLTIRSIIAADSALTLEDPRGLADALDAARARVTASRVALGLEGSSPAPGADEYLTLLNKPTNLADIQAALAPGEALVLLLTGAPRGTVFVIGRDRMDVFQTRRQSGELRLADGSRLAPSPENYALALVDSMRKIGDDLAAGGRARVTPFNVLTAHQAYREFLGAADPALDRYEKLVFAVSGPLSAVPFELLISEPVDRTKVQDIVRGDYSSVRWFAEEKSIAYVPSARSFLDLREASASPAASGDEPAAVFSGYRQVELDRQDTAARALMVANGLAVSGREREDSRCAMLADAVVRLEGLDESGENGRAIGRTLDTLDSVFIGQQFTPGTLAQIGDKLEDYRILHFNTHGLLWDSPDCFVEPALVLNRDTGVPGTTEATDQLLMSSEIQQLPVNADLVVLSACETAGGNGLGGESLSGLARAFFVAGARSVVASHWNAYEESTNRLMQTFYKNLAASEGRDFRGALTAAQTSLRNDPETSHPFYWAPFVLIGDGAGGLGAG